MSSSQACFETIRLNYGRPQNLNCHQRRMERTYRDYFGRSEIPDLSRHFADISPEISRLPIARCRVDYDADGMRETIFTPYTPRPIRRIAWVESDITYPYKFADRSALDALQARTPQADAIIMTQNGYLRDTLTANIALRQKGIWYTPQTPLLPGTTRARLLSEGFLQSRSIHREEIGMYDGLALMNAMVGFVEVGTVLLDGEGRNSLLP